MGKFEKRNQRAMERANGTYIERRAKTATKVFWEGGWYDAITDEIEHVVSVEKNRARKAQRKAERERKRQLNRERRQEQAELAELEAFGMF